MRLVPLIFLILIRSYGFGQFSDAIIGETDSPSRVRNFNGFIGSTKTAIYSLSYNYTNRKKQELNVRKFYKTDLKELESVNLFSNPYDDYWSDPQEIFFQDKKFYLFTLLMGEKDDTKLLRLEVFDESLKQTSDLILDTLKKQEKVLFTEEVDKDGFLVVVFDKLAKIKDRYVNLLALESTGEFRFEKSVKSPVALQNFTVEEFLYKKNSPVFLLCNYSLLGNSAVSSKQDRLINNKYTLWAFDPAIDFLKEFEIRFSVKWANGVQMKMNNKNHLIVSGFVNETRNRSVNGVFSITIDDRLNFLAKHSSSFSEQEINIFLKEKQHGKIKEIENIQLRKMVLLENQSYFLLGEEYDTYIERNYDPRTNITTTTEHFYYTSILVAYFGKNGAINWVKRIPKEQNSTNDAGYFSSFATFVKKNAVYLYFNDHEKNINVDNESSDKVESLNENRRSVIAGIKITADSIGRRKRVSPEDYNFSLQATKSNQILGNTIFLETEGRRAGRIIAIPFKEE